MIENLPVHAGPTMSHSRSMQILDQHMSSSSWTVRLAGLQWKTGNRLVGYSGADHLRKASLMERAHEQQRTSSAERGLSVLSKVTQSMVGSRPPGSKQRQVWLLLLRETSADLCQDGSTAPSRGGKLL